MMFGLFQFLQNIYLCINRPKLKLAGPNLLIGSLYRNTVGSWKEIHCVLIYFTLPFSHFDLELISDMFYSFYSAGFQICRIFAKVRKDKSRLKNIYSDRKNNAFVLFHIPLIQITYGFAFLLAKIFLTPTQ